MRVTRWSSPGLQTTAAGRAPRCTPRARCGTAAHCRRRHRASRPWGRRPDGRRSRRGMPHCSRIRVPTPGMDARRTSDRPSDSPVACVLPAGSTWSVLRVPEPGGRTSPHTAITSLRSNGRSSVSSHPSATSRSTSIVTTMSPDAAGILALPTAGTWPDGPSTTTTSTRWRVQWRCSAPTLRSSRSGRSAPVTMIDTV